MPFIPKTKRNPYGLTIKQQAVIQDIVADIGQGKGFNLSRSVAKFYRVKNIKVARSIASQNLTKLNFNEALKEGLQRHRIIGQDSVIERKLTEGLDAVIEVKNSTNIPTTYPDYKTRLNYIKEIHKIVGLY